MNAEELEKMCDIYQARADHLYNKYQLDGLSRDLNAYEKASDVADVCRQALSSAQDHTAAVHANSIINELAKIADDCKHYGYKPDNVKELIDRCLYHGEYFCGYESRWK